jgi:hypothetical protein
MNTGTEYLLVLNKRRRNLGMSCAVLSKRSGVPKRTVQRILSGYAAASFANVTAIAEALDMDLCPRPRKDAHAVKLTQAREKARKLIGVVQATSALESQAVADDVFESLVDETTCRLVAGPKLRLWSE